MPYVGFSGGTFGSGAVSVDLAGVAARASVGSVSVTAIQNIAPTGVAATISVGTVSVTIEEVAVTWNPSDKSAAYTLSNGNQTATNLTGPPATVLTLVRATTSRSSGKKYFEVQADCSHANQAGAVGLATAGESVNNYLGQTAASWGYWTSGITYHSNTGSHAFDAWISYQPAFMAFAVDFDAGKMWFGLHIAGPSIITWQGGGDPVAGTNATYTFTPNTALFPAFEGDNNPDYGILVSRTSDFVYAIPTGYTSWAS